MRRGIIQNITLLLLLLSVTNSLYAQRNKKTVVIDTVQVAFLNGIAIHTDLLGAYQMQFSDHGQYELGMRINLKDRYFPALEAGVGKADQEQEYTPELKYKTKAPYFRAGCDFNILNNKHDAYKAFAGFRYGFTKFDYDMTTAEAITDDEGNTQINYTPCNNLHCNYHWLEGVFGVDATIWGPLHLGWDVRYRRRLAQKHASEGEPWYIPGYGGQKAAGFTANFNLIISF